MIRVRDFKGRFLSNNIVYNYTIEDPTMLTFYGVYSIINKIDNRLYIGSTCVNFLTRWYEHINSLKNNNHYSLHLQNFVNKYGIDNIEFKIIEVLEDKDIVKDREKVWLDYYGFENCFNLLRETRFSEIYGEKHYLYIKIDKEKVVSLFEKGYRVPEISKIMEVSEAKIKNTLYKLGYDSVRKSMHLPLTEIYFRNMLGKESLESLAKENNVDKWTLRYRLREAGFPSRDTLIKEYFKRFREVKNNVKEWCTKIPFDYCTFLKLRYNEEK